MDVNTILAQIDLGQVVLPVFQRGYVWRRRQVRQLFARMYSRHPVGSLLFWDTNLGETEVKGEIPPAVNPVKMLLDGQQRVTSLYGVIRGKPPAFFDGDQQAFTGLYFNLSDESFEFYQPTKMANDPLWVSVTAVMQGGFAGVGSVLNGIQPQSTEYMGRLLQLLAIKERTLPDDTVSGEEFNVDVVVDIFNDINTGGTTLSSGDLALARICADWPEARDVMKDHLASWKHAGFDGLDIDWLLRSVNTVLTGEAQFSHLQGRSAKEIQDALRRAIDALDYALKLVSAKLGLDHGRVLFGRPAFPVMAYFIDQRKGKLSASEQGRLLYWYVFGAMRGRFSVSTETVINQGLAALKQTDGGLQRLIDDLHTWVGSETITPDHFDAAQTNSRFYPVLYMLTRVGEARNFCDGIELKKFLLGKGASLEVHHIFPKARLYEEGYDRAQVNALGNFCFLTSDCNKEISAKRPDGYFPDYESKFPGVLASQWIPVSDEPWTLDRYQEFLARRRELLADATNRLLSDLRFGSVESMALPEISTGGAGPADEEEAALVEADAWVSSMGMSNGVLGLELNDERGTTIDLAWPEGLQSGKSPKIALLLNEPAYVLAAASAAGFRCFTTVDDLRQYAHSEILLEFDDEVSAEG